MRIDDQRSAAAGKAQPSTKQPPQTSPILKSATSYIVKDAWDPMKNETLRTARFLGGVLRILRPRTAICFITVIIIIKGCLWVRYITSDTVTTELLSEASSPDHRWKAEVVETTVGGTFNTGITADLTLYPQDHPGIAIDILGSDTGGDKNEAPRIRWISNKTLQVTIFYLPSTKISVLDYGGVHIDLRIDPAGEAGHQAFLAYAKSIHMALSADELAH